ncbi:MAG TPA: tetratricopeptide repeat protein [Prosthecobacter sp.]
MTLTTAAFLKTCSVVEGHVELGLLEEAAAMLAALPPGFRNSKRVAALNIAILMKQGDFLRASEMAEVLALGEPDNVEHVLLVARCRFQAGKVVDALWWLQAYAQQCEHSPDYHYFRAECHAAVGDPEAAGTELRVAYDLEGRPHWDPPTRAGEEPVNVFFGAEGMTESL